MPGVSMTIYKTGNKLGSMAPEDLLDNAQNFDHLSADTENEVWPDRLGTPRLTWKGMEERHKRAIASLGFVPFGTFEMGATLTEPTQTLKWDSDGNYYRWDGDFRKIVPANSTPAGTGGIAKGAWVNVTDLTLRSMLASNNPGSGGSLVGLESGLTVEKAVKTVLSRAGVIYDVFVVYGQSNAVGYANNTNGFPDVNDDALWYDYRDGTFKKLVRGIAYSSGNVSTGHAWAAFANEYIKLTGRRVIIIPCARGESSVADLSKPATPSNTTYDKMVASVNAALTAATAAGMQTGFKSILFHQGETDMIQGTVKQTYQNALDQLFRDMRTDMGLNKVFIYRVGNPQNRTEMSWYAMQTAQDYLCQSYEWMVMVYSQCGTFTGGNGLLREGVHYTQDGYNVMGSGSAANVVRCLFEISPSAPAETELYGYPLLPEDQIWRYTYARLVFTEGSGFALISKADTGYSYRTINILSVEMMDATNRVRLHLQSRGNWILGLNTEINYVGLQHGLKCSAALVVVDAASNRYAIELQFVMDLTFAVSMAGAISRSPDLGSQVPPYVSGNITVAKNATYNSVDLTHPGTQKFPIVNPIAGSDFNGETGVASLANVTGTSFSVKNTSGRGVAVTIPAMTIKPSTLMNGLQVGLQAIVCEKKE